jgi:cyanophycin synthetase
MGGNLFFATSGAVLEVLHAPIDADLIAAWQSRIARARSHLKWPEGPIVTRRHKGGMALAIAAPFDHLFLATEVNEWALCASLLERDPKRWKELEPLLIAQALEAAGGDAVAAELLPVIEETAAFARFSHLATREAQPKLRALLRAATDRGLPHVVDETELTLGAGAGSRNFALSALPLEAQIPWQEIADIPTAVVTGSNGKTTTVRLLAACARAHGWHTAYNCTDGVFFDEVPLAQGDYSGPAGARRVIRERRAQAAILETARGGILRRGIAVSQAQTAIITNVSADHFGEYGIDDLSGLAEVKFSVAGTVKSDGLLVLNADDPHLCAQASQLLRRFGRSPALGWFSATSNGTSLRDYRSRGDSTCGVQAGNLVLNYRGEHDLGAIVGMPLTMSGIATYNVANLAGAALGAAALGIPAHTIAQVFARFGADLTDNPGRMMRFEINGVKVLIDYAHNPDGLRGFLRVADHLRSAEGRLGILLGQAGNRADSDIEELAQVAAGFRPDLVVVKEDEAHLRGRSPAEVPRIIRAELKRLGMPDAALPIKNNEVDAARFALDWARPGDVLALPIHSPDARAAVIAMMANH